MCSIIALIKSRRNVTIRGVVMTLRQQIYSDYALKFLTPVTLTLAAWAFNSFAQRLEKVENKLHDIQMNIGLLDTRIAICALRIDEHVKQGE